MHKSNRYDYLSYLLELKETSRSNLSKKTKGNFPTKPYEDLLFMLDEESLRKLCEFHEQVKNGYSAFFGISIQVKENTKLVESKLSKDHNKYILFENETEIFQTFVPKNKSIRVLFDEFYLKDDILEIENELGTALNHNQSFHDASSEEQKQLKRIRNNFIQSEHLKYTQKKQSVNFSSKTIYTISIKDYLLERFSLENFCIYIYEKEKHELISLQVGDQHDYFVKKLFYGSYITSLHPSLNLSIINEWFEKNHH